MGVIFFTWWFADKSAAVYVLFISRDFSTLNNCVYFWIILSFRVGTVHRKRELILGRNIKEWAMCIMETVRATSKSHASINKSSKKMVYIFLHTKYILRRLEIYLVGRSMARKPEPNFHSLFNQGRPEGYPYVMLCTLHMRHNQYHCFVSLRWCSLKMQLAFLCSIAQNDHPRVYLVYHSRCHRGQL